MTQPPPIEAPASELAPRARGASFHTERWIVWLVAGVQFVNILDFMIVMPLGPDFAIALGIPMSQLGLIGGSYTAAAAVSGVLGAVFLDRFDRRLALGVALLGLVCSTALGGFATGFASLLLTRILAGAFGGPATSVALAIVTDAIPAERRGRAMGTVMTAFSAASVLGVPAGLELARLVSWRAPFFAVALLGLLVTAVAIAMLPPMRAHIGLRRVPPTRAPLGPGGAGSPPSAARRDTAPPPVALAESGALGGGPASSRWVVPRTFKGLDLGADTLRSLASTAFVMLGIFAVVPNLAAYVQYNLGLPRSSIGTLYLVGGLASLLTVRLVGNLVDRFGSARLVTLGTAIHLLVLFALFYHPITSVPVIVWFTLFMLSGGFRMVPMQTLATRVPRQEQRARFMSAQSALQHSASAVGAMAGSLLLVAEPDGSLTGMPQVALFAAGSAALVPLLVTLVERSVNRRVG